MELLLQRNCFHGNPPLLCKQRYIWPHVLQHEIKQFIDEQGNGKVPLSLVTQQFGVALHSLEQLNTENTVCYILGHHPHQQLWTEHRLQTSLQQLWDTVLSSSSPLRVSRVAKSIWALPFTTTLDLIREYLPNNGVELRTLDNGTHVLISQASLTEFQRLVEEHFRSFTAPVSIASVCAQLKWECSWVFPILIQNTTPGVLQGDDLYIPNQYMQEQQQATWELFQTVGVVTDAKHSIHQLMEWLLPLEPVQLSHALVHPIRICHPMEAALQEAPVLDLQNWIPSSLSLEDGRLLVQHVTQHIKGTFVWNTTGGGLFFSASMMASFAQHTIPLLVQEYARERAQQLASEDGGAKAILDSCFEQHEQKDRKHKKKNNVPTIAAIDYGTVPVERVVQHIRTQYCEELSEFDCDDATWNEISAIAFLSSDTHTKQCQTAIHAELRRMLEAQRTNTVPVLSTNNNIPIEFESTDCFAYACYLVQMFDHFVQYAKEAGMDETDISVLQNELFQGPCADLTWRITQYCLFRNAIDDDASLSLGTRADPYYKPADIALRSYNPIHLSYSEAKDPLTALRQTLPALARLWVLCGERDMDAFRDHVQENCLPLIGLPYKVLDKKSEKKLLSTRRDVLLERVQSEQDPALLLDWTIMLLYQQVKNLVVSGSLLRGPILRLLTKERKITREVAGDLMALGERIEKGEVVESDLLERVRNCVLKRK